MEKKEEVILPVARKRRVWPWVVSGVVVVAMTGSGAAWAAVSSAAAARDDAASAVAECEAVVSRLNVEVGHSRQLLDLASDLLTDGSEEVKLLDEAAQTTITPCPKFSEDAKKAKWLELSAVAQERIAAAEGSVVEVSKVNGDTAQALVPVAKEKREVAEASLDKAVSAGQKAVKAATKAESKQSKAVEGAIKEAKDILEADSQAAIMPIHVISETASLIATVQEDVAQTSALKDVESALKKRTKALSAAVVARQKAEAEAAAAAAAAEQAAAVSQSYEEWDGGYAGQSYGSQSYGSQSYSSTGNGGGSSSGSSSGSGSGSDYRPASTWDIDDHWAGVAPDSNGNWQDTCWVNGHSTLC